MKSLFGKTNVISNRVTFYPKYGRFFSTTTPKLSVDDQVRVDLMDMATKRHLVVTLSAVLHQNILPQLKPFPAQISAEEIAKKSGCQVDPVYRMLRFLSAHGYGQEHANGSFSHTEKSQVLAETDLKYGALVLGGDLYIRTISNSNICEVAKKSTEKHSVNCIEVEYGASLFDVVTDPKKYDLGEYQTKYFSKYFKSLNDPRTLAAIATSYNFGQFKTIVDVGGSMGYMLATILQNHSSINKGYLFDLPHVVEAAKNLMPKDVKNVEYVSGSFFEQIPIKADAYFLKLVLHDWTDEQCIQILSNVRKNCHSSSKVFVCELGFLEEKGKQSSPEINYLDIHMLYATGGRERTVSQLDAIFQKSGFKRKHDPITGPMFGLVVGETV